MTDTKDDGGPVFQVPMHRMTPQQHADLGWSWGAYKDGACLSLCANDPDMLSDFYADAFRAGAEVINLSQLSARKGE
jgi:hypothetical protein